MNLKALTTPIKLNAKNLVGWKTRRKIVVLSVDDYGNVRLHSKAARDNLRRSGLKVMTRFDALDALETKQDLEMLFDTLTSVKDGNGRHAVITAFAVPCNIDFETIRDANYKGYHYELLPQTFNKLAVSDPASYSGAWELWKEGMSKHLITPQFHGREHLNLKVFEEKLNAGDFELLTCLNNRSYTSIDYNGDVNISPMAAFDFWAFEENANFHRIIGDGLDQFEKVFGFRATNFMPPVCKLHPVLYETLSRHGISFIDAKMWNNEHQGNGIYKNSFNYTGKKIHNELYSIVRNIVFEPTENRDVDWPNYAMKQIEAAFRWKKPAIISSHRVNFCGHIDPQNRKTGLGALKKLLKSIVKRWPEVEFMAANELGALISGRE